jgi:anti-sigma28 factor (negative regulator of flagellin synthesis)
MSVHHIDLIPDAQYGGLPSAGEESRPTRWRQVRLQRLRERIQRGEYEVDPDAVATAMIEHLRAARTR